MNTRQYLCLEITNIYPHFMSPLHPLPGRSVLLFSNAAFAHELREQCLPQTPVVLFPSSNEHMSTGGSLSTELGSILRTHAQAVGAVPTGYRFSAFTV